MKPGIWHTILIMLAFCAGQPAAAGQSRLIDFALEDQFGDTHTRENVAGKIVLLIGGDGGGGPACRPWTNAIESTLAGHARYDRVAKLAYADLRVVPRFLKGWARKKFPTDPEEWAMMDWRGRIARAYDFTSGRCNILIFTPEGALAYHAAVTRIEPKKLAALLGIMQRLLDAPD